MTRILSIVMFCLICAIASFGQQAQISAGYLYQGSQQVPGSGWFGMNGGRSDILFPVTRHVGVVGEFSGVHTGSMASSGMGLTLLTYMAGPRLSFTVHGAGEKGKLTAFGQTLFGGVHATQGAFPSDSALNSTASSFAMSMGGGLQVGVNRRTQLRLIQADYLYTRLPNLFDSRQNNFRVGAGIVLQLR